MLRRFLISLLPAFFLALTQCGYTLSHRLRAEFRDPRGIFVPVFDNMTDEVGAEIVFTNALIREITSRRKILLSTREKGALELHGVITDIRVEPTTLTDAGFKGLQGYQRIPSELGVRVNLALVLRDPKSGKIYWSHDFSGYRRVNAPTDRTYDYQSPSSVGVATQSIYESEYPEIARQIVRDVYDEMVEVF
ncbi:MAG: hypothetical protein KDD39_08990 [Bdellovibrionales bacterium]|nr:hypothetical protein [Bdellovibrionales bacterium]